MNYTMLKEGDKHTLRRIDLRDMMDQEPQEDKPDIEHFATRRVAGDGMSYEDTMAHIDKALAEGERPRSVSQCVDCGGQTLAPANDWSQSRGIPFDNNNKWQFYYERGDSRPEEYGDVPEHWAPFGSWESSGFCKDCHPGNPKKQARRAAARLYVARCQRAGRLPTPHGLRRFMESQQHNAKPRTSAQPKNQGLYDHYMNDTGPNYPGKTVVDFTDPQWQTKTNWDGSRYDADGSPVFPSVLHSDRVKGKPYFISPHPAHPTGWYKSQDYAEHRQTCPTCSSGKRHASRRRAEHFDITEEGGTPKGKGRPSKKTTMSTPDAQWHRRNRGGRYT
jgi:hypothetical protein